MTRLNRLPLATALTVAASLPVLAPAQGAPDSGHGIVTMTRGMRVFGDAEARIVAALKGRDAAVLDGLVAPDFEQRTQAAPGTPLPREDWLKQAPAAAVQSGGFRQMAVHDFGDTAVVSFQWLHPAPDFIVDVWRKKTGTDDWELAVRYASGAAPAAAAPAASAAVHARKPSASSAPASSPVDPKR